MIGAVRKCWKQGRTAGRSIYSDAGGNPENLRSAIVDKPGTHVFVSANRDDVQRIVILNAKGGCGKTTLATNLASYFAIRGPRPALLDCDPQGASMRWLEKRPKNRPPIHGIAGYKSSMNATRSWQLRVPRETRRLIVDTAAALEGPEIHNIIYDANNILIPVMPSPIDIRFAARFIAELLLVAQLDRGGVQVGVVANRTRANTKSLQKLMRFLTSLKIPIVGILSDSQNYVAAVEEGIGVFELPHHRARKDEDQMANIVRWLDRWQPPVSESVAKPTVPVFSIDQTRQVQ